MHWSPTRIQQQIVDGAELLERVGCFCKIGLKIFPYCTSSFKIITSMYCGPRFQPYEVRMVSSQINHLDERRVY